MTSKNDRSHPLFFWLLRKKRKDSTKSVVPESCLSLTTASVVFSFCKDWNVSKLHISLQWMFFCRRGFVGGCALVDFIYFDFDCPFGCKGMPGANHSTGPRRNGLWWKISVLLVYLVCWLKNRKDGGNSAAIHINYTASTECVVLFTFGDDPVRFFFSKTGGSTTISHSPSALMVKGTLSEWPILLLAGWLFVKMFTIFCVHNLCFYLRLFWPTLLVLTLQLAIWVGFGYRFAALLKWPNLESYRIQRENSRSACGVFSPGNDETYPDTNGFQENHPLKNAGW